MTSFTFETPFTKLDPEIQNNLSKIQENILNQRLNSKEITHLNTVNSDRVQTSYTKLRSQITDIAGALLEERTTVQEFVQKSSRQLDTSDEAQRLVQKMTTSNIPTLQTTYLPSPYMWGRYRSFQTRLDTACQNMKSIQDFIDKSSQNLEPKSLAELSEQINNLQQIFITTQDQLLKIVDQIEKEKKTFLSLRSKYINDDTDPFQEHATLKRKVDPLKAIAEGQSEEEFQNITGAQLMEYASHIGVTPQDLNLLGPAAVSALPITKQQQKQFFEELEKQKNGPNTEKNKSGDSWSNTNSDSNSSGGWGTKTDSNSKNSSSGGWGDAADTKNSDSSSTSSGWGDSSSTTNNESKNSDSSSSNSGGWGGTDDNSTSNTTTSESSGGWSQNDKSSSSDNSTSETSGGWGGSESSNNSSSNNSSSGGWGDSSDTGSSSGWGT